MHRAVFFALSATGFAAAAWLASRRATATEEATAQAVATGGSFQARLTGYWPVSDTASAAEKRMEGGNNDRKGKPLHSLEQHQADPAAHPYVSVAGDDAIFPYGQRIELDAWPRAVFRVVDTGGHFRGAGKVYRVLGREPLDIRVNSNKTVVPKTATAVIRKGDHFDKTSREVAAHKFEGQALVGSAQNRWGSGLDLFGVDDA